MDRSNRTRVRPAIPRIASDPQASVQRNKPFGRLAPREVLALPVEKIDPQIRIAHRIRGAINVPERIIFDHEIVLIVAGEGELEIGGERVQFAAHHLLFIQPFKPHTFRSDERCDHVAVHFDFAPGVPALGRDPRRRKPYEVRLSQGLAIPAHVILSAAVKVGPALLELVRVTEQAAPAAGLQAKALLLEALVGLFRINRETGASQPGADHRNRVRVERAVKFIDEHFAQPLDARDLARAAGLSPSHFTRLFREWAGYSPVEYLRHVRVGKARALLADVDLSIKEVAARAGFEDAYHFSKVFHQIDGLPPSAYREILLAGRTPTRVFDSK